MSANDAVAGRLETISQMLDLLGEDSFRASAHARAARLIEGLSTDVSQMSRDELLAIKGIGAKMADKIIEFVNTGSIEEEQELRAKVPAGLLTMLTIPGLGPKTVRAIWTTLNITDLPALEAAIADGRLLTLPRMGEKAVEKIRQGIEFAKQGNQRLWLGRAFEVASRVVAHVRHLPGVAQVMPAGSLRRGKETVGDLDVLVAMKHGHDANAPTVMDAFRTMPGVVAVLAAGDSKSSVRMEINHDLARWGAKKKEDQEHAAETPAPAAGPSIQVDMRVLPLDCWGAALMYFTGSKEHNVRLRERALSMGLTLSEWGLFPNDDHDTPPHQRGVKPVAAATEEDVYHALGLAWIPPEAREDRGEIERSELGTVKVGSDAKARARTGGTPVPPADSGKIATTPWALIELGDIKAELHAHTTASDGSLSIVELATEAKSRGFHTIAVTDHSQSSTIANGLRPDRLRRHIDAIREAASQLKGITLLAGSEVDILADGSLDYDDDLLAELDVIVASPHAALTQDGPTATNRLLKAIEHPLVNILGHPTGRLINRRKGLEPDMAALFAAASACGVALEINAHWMRLDLRDTHVRGALDAGCLIAIDCDVHEKADYDNLAFGVMTGRRGWLTPARCVNTWAPAKLHAWLKRGRD
ncbi:MAG: PHP domain-containing protein [Tepidisphaera sp.]|nr:PHP domain-containing protein [Tepidisphaera sp.]